MKKIEEIKEIQKIEFEILCHFDELCRKNNISYFLNGGTLLGAVRHKGFIPWDDDVDVLVPRKDYERLLKLPEATGGRYPVVSLKNDRDYYYTFAKMMDAKTRLFETGFPDIPSLGVYIDIFPMDYVPNHNLTRKMYQFGIATLRNMAGYSIMEKEQADFNRIDTIKYYISKFFTRRKIICLIDRICCRKSRTPTRYSMDLVSAIHPYMKMEAKNFIQECPVSFCGKTFPAPNGYEQYLTALYGDYMELPPEKDRKSNHSFEAYWK